MQQRKKKPVNQDSLIVYSEFKTDYRVYDIGIMSNPSQDIYIVLDPEPGYSRSSTIRFFDSKTLLSQGPAIESGIEAFTFVAPVNNDKNLILGKFRRPWNKKPALYDCNEKKIVLEYSSPQTAFHISELVILEENNIAASRAVKAQMDGGGYYITVWKINGDMIYDIDISHRGAPPPLRILTCDQDYDSIKDAAQNADKFRLFSDGRFLVTTSIKFWDIGEKNYMGVYSYSSPTLTCKLLLDLRFPKDLCSIILDYAKGEGHRLFDVRKTISYAIEKDAQKKKQKKKGLNPEASTFKPR